MTHGQRFKKESTKALEALAAAEFSEKAVLDACRARAVEGYTWCEVRPSRPVDVSKTAAVSAMLATLAKDRLRFEWDPVKDRAEVPAYQVLRVSWDAA